MEHEYYFVTMGPAEFGVEPSDPNQEMRDRMGSYYRYDIFMALMKKLEAQYKYHPNSGFWNNRGQILYHSHSLVVVVSKSSLEVKGFYIILNRKPGKEEIFILEVFEKRKGLGKMIVQRERSVKPFSKFYVDETLGQAVPFWDALEIPYKTVIHK